jgi:hypothetical protein
LTRVESKPCSASHAFTAAPPTSPCTHSEAVLSLTVSMSIATSLSGTTAPSRSRAMRSSPG